MEKTLAIMIGIPGSGKSTFYRGRLADGYDRVTLDTLKTHNSMRTGLFSLGQFIKLNMMFALANLYLADRRGPLD